MVIQETYKKKFVKSYSDCGKYILQDKTGKKYKAAIDKKNTRHTYTETDEDIPRRNDHE